MFTQLTRSIFLTGVLSPPIVVNSSYPLKTLEYSVQMSQDINLGPLYIQGGPGKAISEFKIKNIKGSISLNPRITQSNTLESAVEELINAGQNYKEKISLTTLLIPYNPNVTWDTEPFNYESDIVRSLIFDTCVVEKTTITAKENEDFKISYEIIGQVDEPNADPVNFPQEENSLYRKLTWFDCFFSRDGSQMENVYSVEISCVKEIDQPFFLFPYATDERYDSVFSTGVKAVYVTFKYVERITSIFDLMSYSFGGWKDGINFSGNFGPISFQIPNAVMQVSSQSLPSGIIERTTSGFYRLIPNTPDTENFLFSFS
jgi:hypothetical protein